MPGRDNFAFLLNRFCNAHGYNGRGHSGNRGANQGRRTKWEPSQIPCKGTCNQNARMLNKYAARDQSSFSPQKLTLFDKKPSQYSASNDQHELHRHDRNQQQRIGIGSDPKEKPKCRCCERANNQVVAPTSPE